MSGRLTTALLAAVAFEFMLSASAAAGTVTYEDGVFRYRDGPAQSADVFLESVRPAKTDGTPGRLRGSARAPLTTGPGCSATPSEALGEEDDFVCVLTKPGFPRYRLSLGDRADEAGVGFSDPAFRGVIYAGLGADSVSGGTWRVYGGRGDDDSLDGQRVYGGPGNDRLESGGLSNDGLRSVLRGGAGNDRLHLWTGRGGWAYGGPGNDDLVPSQGRDMLVGGPGYDEIGFISDTSGPDASVDVFRLRDGRRDFVDCLGYSDRKDVFFADRTDVFWETFTHDVLFQNRCRDSRVLFSGRPQLIR